MVPEAELEQTDAGLVPASAGWFVMKGAGSRSRDRATAFRSPATTSTKLGDGDLLRAWPSLTIQERRRLMHGVLELIIVTRADRRGRHARPVSERAQIILRGGAVLEPSADARIF